MTKSQTNPTITALKVIATFLVVYIHGANIFGYAGLDAPILFKPFFSLADAAVPVFMLVSGYLLFRKEIVWKENLKKKIFRLAVPFLIWSCFWILIEAVGYIVMPDKFENVFSWSVSNWFLKIIGIPFYVSPLYRPLWYVRDLFLLSVIAPFFQKPLKRFPTLFAIIAIGVWFLPLSNSLREAITFFILGGVIATQTKVLGLIRRNCTILVLFLSLALGVGLSFLYNDYCYRLSILFMVFAVYIGCVSMSCYSIFRRICSCLIPYSFAIYVLHGKLLSIIQILYTRKFASNASTYLGYFILPFLVFWVCYFIALLFKKVGLKLFTVSMGELKI